MAIVKIEKFIQAPPSEAYPYFTNSTALRDWLCDLATADPRPGGRLFMWWNGDYYTCGEYIKVEEDKFVSFTWFGRGEPGPTTVEVTFKKQKGGTLVKLVHRGLGRSQKWAEIGAGYEKEWRNGLENLASVLEKGSDLRITNRPMLGIIVDEYNAKIAKRLGVPVEQGIHLGDVVEGMGAQKSGLQKGDVIVGMDGHEITGGATFGAVIESKRAGDVVDVAFYRGPEKKITKMTLSGRPIPAIPASGDELSRVVEQIYHRFETEIENILNSASEKECTTKPAPTEWSVNEILAHLIHSERGWHNALSEIIGGHEAAYDGFGGNIQARIDGTLAAYPSKMELFQELKHHDAETISMLAHISTEFLAHKGRYWKLAYLAQQIPYHLQAHVEQIQDAIQASRK
jgi:uncharacterized protein YndB with AHSA1/START domain/uncharacterized damage-inducible protein DinB